MSKDNATVTIGVDEYEMLKAKAEAYDCIDEPPYNPQLDVSVFMRKMRQYVGPAAHVPPPHVVSLRTRLILSEAMETCEALWDGDLPKVIDGLNDLNYVSYGTGVAIGVDLRPFWHEVHRSNMQKDPDVQDVHGKVIKPAGFIPPDIEGILDQLHAGWRNRG